MFPRSDQHTIAIVTACMKVDDGSPAFALTEFEVTNEEAENGVHYYLAEIELSKRGYEEPFVHFSDSESPPFLHDAVRQFLPPVVNKPTIHAQSEEQRCPVSSR